MSAPISKADKIENPKKAFSHPAEVTKDPDLTRKEKAKALDQLEQDEHQLITADNEGMAPEKPEAADQQELGKVLRAKDKLGVPPKHKPSH